MKTAAKIYLSAQEKQLIANTEWILTKRSIIDKVYGLLGHLSEEIKSRVTDQPSLLPSPVTAAARIYKGEN